MSRPSERLRRLGRHLASLVTGPAAGPRDFTPRAGRGARDEGRVGPLSRLTPHPSPRAPRPLVRGTSLRAREAAAGAAEPAREEGDELPRRPADAAPRAREAADTATEAVARPEPGPGARAHPAAPQDREAPNLMRFRAGTGARAHPAASQDPPEGLSPAEVPRGIARPSRRAGEGVAEPPSRGAAPRHGPLGDLGDRVDQVGNDQARMARQLVQLSDQARAAWRAAQEVTRQLQQVHRNALKR